MQTQEGEAPRAFAPRTRWGQFMRDQMIKTSAIPGLARLAFGEASSTNSRCQITAGRDSWLRYRSLCWYGEISAIYFPAHQ
jgi:hypothetical protein